LSQINDFLWYSAPFKGNFVNEAVKKRSKLMSVNA